MEDARKRVDLLLAAFALVRRQRPDVRLLLNRPGDPALVARASQPGVELVDPRKLEGGFSGLYSRGWVTALTSEAEAFGLVLVEALACGTPIVAPADGGGAEIIGAPATGRLFTEHTPEPVAAALLDVLARPHDDAVAAACRGRAEEFSRERMVASHLELYRGLGLVA
jgi:glycosyltransferase involved in cell wall biosynthesis